MYDQLKSEDNNCFVITRKSKVTCYFKHLLVGDIVGVVLFTGVVPTDVESDKNILQYYN